MPAADIGLISDCPLQRHMMQSAVQACGYLVATNSDPSRLDKTYLDRHHSVAAWVVILIDEDRWDEAVNTLIDHARAPVLFGLSAAPDKQSRDYAKWERRLLSKLVELLGEPDTLAEKSASISVLPANAQANTEKLPLPPHIQPAKPTDQVERVVILAASLGGPSAVKAFLDRLPAGLPAAFIYAQHIDQNAANVLIRVLGRHAAMTLHTARAGENPRNGEIIIVPVEHEISFDSDGRIIFHQHEWPGPYGPSIDQVMLNVANCYGPKTCVILFSGMGNDGSIAGPLLKASGSSVWSQTSESCASSSMPDSVAATGCVNFRGTPAQLAEKLIITIEAEERIKRRQTGLNS